MHSISFADVSFICMGAALGFVFAYLFGICPPSNANEYVVFGMALLNGLFLAGGAVLCRCYLLNGHGIASYGELVWCVLAGTSCVAIILILTVSPHTVMWAVVWAWPTLVTPVIAGVGGLAAIVDHYSQPSAKSWSHYAGIALSVSYVEAAILFWTMT